MSAYWLCWMLFIFKESLMFHSVWNTIYVTIISFRGLLIIEVKVVINYTYRGRNWNKFKGLKWVSRGLCSACDVMTLVALGWGMFWICPFYHRESWDFSLHRGDRHSWSCSGSIILALWEVLAETQTLASCRDLSVIHFLTVICHGVGRKDLGFSDFGLCTEIPF